MASLAQIATPICCSNGGLRSSLGIALVLRTFTARFDGRLSLDRRHDDSGFDAVDVS
jgi:hypothetical protein